MSRIWRIVRLHKNAPTKRWWCHDLYCSIDAEASDMDHDSIEVELVVWFGWIGNDACGITCQSLVRARAPLVSVVVTAAVGYCYLCSLVCSRGCVYQLPAERCSLRMNFYPSRIWQVAVLFLLPGVWYPRGVNLQSRIMLATDAIKKFGECRLLNWESILVRHGTYISKNDGLLRVAVKEGRLIWFRRSPLGLFYIAFQRQLWNGTITQFFWGCVVRLILYGHTANWDVARVCVERYMYDRVRKSQD